jgi:hypothetical protein
MNRFMVLPPFRSAAPRRFRAPLKELAQGIASVYILTRFHISRKVFAIDFDFWKKLFIKQGKGLG